MVSAMATSPNTGLTMNIANTVPTAPTSGTIGGTRRLGRKDTNPSLVSSRSTRLIIR